MLLRTTTYGYLPTIQIQRQNLGRWKMLAYSILLTVGIATVANLLLFVFSMSLYVSQLSLLVSKSVLDSPITFCSCASCEKPYNDDDYCSSGEPIVNHEIDIELPGRKYNLSILRMTFCSSTIV